jgi:hypothetical protein
VIKTVFFLESVIAVLAISAVLDKTTELVAVLAEANESVRLAGAVSSVLKVHTIGTRVNGRAGVLDFKHTHIFILRSVARVADSVSA